MSRAIPFGAALVGVLLLCVGRAEAGADWLTRLDQAERVAATSGKDLLILFTGTQWCSACTEFENAVLSRPDFVCGAEPFILVKLEFPASFENLPPDRRKDYIAWRDRYGIRLFPTVLLADSTGRPYAVTGHIGLKAAEYVRHLGKLHQVRAQRDTALSQAANAQGVEKAHNLDVALSTLQEAFDKSYTELQGDMLVRFYRPEIAQILALDPTNAAGMRDKYRGLLDADAERDRIAEMHAGFEAAMRQGGADAALKLVDSELERPRSAELRKRLRTTRLFYLEWGDRHAEALEYATDLATDESYSPAERRKFQSRVAFHMAKLGRADEAAAVYDRLIAEVSGSREARWCLLRDKAHMLTTAGRLIEALEVWESSRPCVEPGTGHWMDTEIYRSRLLARLGRQSDAIAGFDAALDTKSLTPLDRATLFVEEAIVLSKAGHQKEVNAIAERAEKVLESIEPQSSNESGMKYLRNKLRAVRGDARNEDKKVVPRDR